MIAGRFTAASAVKIEFDESIAAQVLTYVSSGRIVFKPSYLNPTNPNFDPEYGTIIHELVHIALPKNGIDTVPIMLNEGGADWFREYVYGGQQPRRPNTTEAYEDGYAPSSFFLNWIMKTYQKAQPARRCQRTCQR